MNKKNSLRNFATVTIVILDIILISLALILVLIFYDQPIKKHFTYIAYDKNANLLQCVAEELQDESYDHIFIDAKSLSNGVLVRNEIGKSEYIDVDDIIESEIMKLFLDNGFKSIEKDGDIICFDRYSSLGTGYGILYTMNGDFFGGELFKAFEELDEKGWYYYEAS